MLSTDALNATSDVTALLPLFKVVRLLRVVLVMTRIQRSRERYRRMKMVGLAAPVEKVFEIISDLRRKARTRRARTRERARGARTRTRRTHTSG